jgi:hypothetical protein
LCFKSIATLFTIVVVLLSLSRPPVVCFFFLLYVQTLNHVPNDAEMLLHAADALVSLDQISSDALDYDTGVHFLEALVGSAVSTLTSDSATDRKKRRMRSQEEHEVEEALRCVALNNEALVLAAQGCETHACQLLKRAILISPANEVSL